MISTSRQIVLLFCVCALASCGGDKVEMKQTAGEGGKKYGGIYRMNVLRGSPNGLDPVLIGSKHADDIASQIYDRLVDLDPKLNLVPELAKDLPTVTGEGRIYTFALRTDVYFHDNPCFPDGKGRRMTAEDVRYSLTRCCDPRTRTVANWAFNDKVKGATEYYDSIIEWEKRRDTSAAGKQRSAQDTAVKGRLFSVEGFRVVNDSTFQIELIQPHSPFLYYLVNALGNVLPQEAVERYGKDFFQNPVGTGPFVFTSWKPDQELVLKRNPNYWGTDANGNRLPFLDEIHFRFIKDDKIQFNEFTSGGLEESFNVPTEQFTNVFDPATRQPKPEFKNYQVQQAPAMLTWFFDMNVQLPPFNKPDVRRAFNYAIDREKIVRFALQNSPSAPAVHGLIPPVFKDYPIDSIKGYSFDPVKAKELLAKAGYPDGKGFPNITLYLYPEPRLKTVGEAVQEMLVATLNIPVDVKIIDFPQLQEQAELGKLGLWGARWFADYPDAETFLLLLDGTLVPKDASVKSYPNSTRYNNPAYNEALKRGVSTIDHQMQIKHYADAERIAMADAPVIPLFYEMHYRLLRSNVRDTPLDAMARYDLKFTWLDGE